VVKVNGIEVRLGGNAGQSVSPPSRHRSGVQYQWLPGMSPSDVDVARLPKAFKQAMFAENKKPDRRGLRPAGPRGFGSRRDDRGG
jgi:hypothetical protein